MTLSMNLGENSYDIVVKRGALREARTILHIGRDGWFFGTVAEYLASPAGKRFGGAL